MPERGDARGPGEQLFQQGQTFGDQFGTQSGQAWDVSAGLCEVGYESVSDRILHDRHDNGNRGGRLLDSATDSRRRRDNDVDLETDDFSRQSRETLESFLRSS